jgi:thioredoxin-like negative regulator of GroEL
MEFPSQMLRLKSQEQFETDILNTKTGPAYVCIVFSAAWCGPCKKLDKEGLVRAHADITWYGCDVDENTYTHGYCGLKKIPSYVFVKNGKFVDKLEGTTDIGAINSWLYVCRTK